MKINKKGEKYVKKTYIESKEEIYVEKLTYSEKVKDIKPESIIENNTKDKENRKRPQT